MTPSHNDMRNDMRSVVCPVCADTFTPIRRQRYCTPACRQAAWRARHLTTRPAVVVPAVTGRRDNTVYQCTACETRYLGRQYCHDCHRPCVRVDLGALCPHCDTPITISDILNQHPTPPARR